MERFSNPDLSSDIPDMFDFNQYYMCDNTYLETPRKSSRKDVLLCHLNINSPQNKFEELSEIIQRLDIHTMFVSETKTDSSYQNNQFTTPGCSLYRNDQKKGGGGVMALISNALISKRIAIKKNCKTLEPIAVKVTMRLMNMLTLCIYCSPKKLCQW